MAKQNTIKFINKKVRNNGGISDYKQTPLGADSDNIDRPDGSTAEENFVDIDNGVDIGRTLKYEDPYLYLLDGQGKELSRVLLVLPSHVHNYSTEEITKEATYTEAGLKKCTCACGDYHTEEIPMLVDSTNPTGTITVGENTYTSLVENPSFNTYFKTAQNVTIAGIDNESGVKNISYYVSDTKVDETGLDDVAWVAYDSGFTIEPNRNAVVYAKITDNQDNVTYICSDGIVLDNITPVFNGMEDGGTYGVGTTLTLQDGETLFVNGTEVELTDNTYTFNVEDNYLLSIKDKSGNESSINITISVSNIAPDNEYRNWLYELDNTDCTIHLKEYIGNDTDVAIYSNYDIDGQIYKTKLYDFGFHKNLFYNNNRNNATPVKHVILQKVIITTDISFMFADCVKLESININKLDTSNVINMSDAFAYCPLLSTLDLRNFDTRKVTKMTNMFDGSRGLTAIYVNESIWKTSQANTSNMFLNCGVSEVTYKDAA